MFFQERPKPHILEQVSGESSVFTIEGLPFLHRKSIQKSTFCRGTLPELTFAGFMLIFEENGRFWAPPGIRSCPKTRPKYLMWL